MSGSPSSSWRAFRRSAEIALTYACVAAAWILFSDSVLNWLVSDAGTLSLLQTFKGLFFVVATAILLLLLYMRSARELEAEVEERLKREEALRKSETKLHAIFDHHYQLTGLLGPEGRLLAANRTALRFANVEESAVIGRYFWETPWWDASQRSEIRDAFRRAAGGEFVRFETTHPTGDGRSRRIDFSMTPVRDDDGQVVYVVPEGRDITEIRQAEEERARLQKQLNQAEMMASMGSLVVAVAHEVRNPLFGITAILDSLEARCEGNEDIERYAVPLREQVARLSQLMNDLLQYGRPREADLHLSSVTSVIGQASEACSFLARERNVELRVSGHEELPELRLDATRLTQAFQNVIQNAIEHSPEGDAVDLVTTLCAVDRGREITCRVSDSGPGFHVDHLEHVFEPFFTQRQGGTGLGLALAWKIVHEHGGRIAVANAAGGGAVVTITLPVPS